MKAFALGDIDDHNLFEGSIPPLLDASPFPGSVPYLDDDMFPGF